MSAAMSRPLSSNTRPFPAAGLVVVQVQAGGFRKMRCRHQLALEVVGPAVQRADDVLVRRVAAPVQDDRLPVPADVGDELHAVRGAHQRAALAFLRQGVEVARVGHGQFMTQVARPLAKDGVHLALEHRLVEVVRRGQRAGVAQWLVCTARQQGTRCKGQVGHGPLGLLGGAAWAPGPGAGPTASVRHVGRDSSRRSFANGSAPGRALTTIRT